MTKDREGQAAGVHDDVSFAAVGFLARVVAAGGSADGFRASHRLGVDHRRGRLRVAVLDLLTDLFAQAVVHSVEGSVGGPGLEVVVDELVVGEVGRERVPLAAGAVEVADRVDHVDVLDTPSDSDCCGYAR
nr:hypothetical protein [Micromonospora deserti]